MSAWCRIDPFFLYDLRMRIGLYFNHFFLFFCYAFKSTFISPFIPFSFHAQPIRSDTSVYALVTGCCPILRINNLVVMLRFEQSQFLLVSSFHKKANAFRSRLQGTRWSQRWHMCTYVCLYAIQNPLRLYCFSRFSMLIWLDCARLGALLVERKLLVRFHMFM